MMGDNTSWQPDTPVNQEVNNTPLIKEYYSDGTVGVGVDDAYKLHTADRRKHDAKRTLRKLPLVLIVLAFMVLTPIAIIKLTAGNDSDATTPTGSTNRPVAKTPAAKPATQAAATQDATSAPSSSTSSASATSTSGETNHTTTKKTVVKRKVIVKKKTYYRTHTVASTATVGQSVGSASTPTSTTSTTATTGASTAPNKPTATSPSPQPTTTKPPQKTTTKKPVIKKPVKKPQKPKQQIGTAVTKTSKPKQTKPNKPVQKPATRPKPTKPAQKPVVKPKPVTKPKPAPKPTKPAAKPKPAQTKGYVGGPAKFVDYNQQSWGPRIASSGCGPTAAAIVVSSLTDRRVNPRQMSDVLTPKYYIPGSGTRQEAATFHYIAKRFNLRYNHPKNYAEITQTLRQGGMVIAYAKPGAFTQNGHFIVIRKVSQDGQRYVIADPNVHNNTERKHWTAEELRRGGIADFWGFTPRQ